MSKYAKTAKLEKLITKTISVQEFAKKHNKSVLTIHNWRGEGLPSISIPGSARPAIRLVTKEAEDWMKDNKSEKPTKKKKKGKGNGIIVLNSLRKGRGHKAKAA